jgi:glucosamine-phosphate N-acetyltransferase
MLVLKTGCVNTKMIYRECTIDDFDRILPLFDQLWPDQPLNDAIMRQVFENGICSEHQYYLCVEADERIVGFCSLTVKNNLWQQGNLGHIDELVVDEPFRRRGIGKELLNRIIQIAEEKGCMRIELDSAFNRTKAHDFYEKNEFKKRALLFSRIVSHSQQINGSEG